MIGIATVVLSRKQETMPALGLESVKGIGGGAGQSPVTCLILLIFLYPKNGNTFQIILKH